MEQRAPVGNEVGTISGAVRRLFGAARDGAFKLCVAVSPFPQKKAERMGHPAYARTIQNGVPTGLIFDVGSIIPLAEAEANERCVYGANGFRRRGRVRRRGGGPWL